MALIKCEECGKEVSDKAPSCIHCGCPIVSTSKQGVIKLKVGSLSGAVTRISLVDTDGEELALVHENTLTTIEIDKEMDIYAQRLGHKDSNVVTVYPHKVNKLQLSSTGFFNTQLVLNEIDVIDSD